ncbi:MAG: PIN domain-containing protein [Rhizobium sp.]
MIEYEAVMTRPEHLKVSGLSAADVGTVLDAVTDMATPVHLAFLWRPVLKDADDDMVLETAVNGRADAIVTFNLKDFGKHPQRFSIDVISPGNALKGLEQGR